MNKKVPKISIITVVYNCESTIERTIKSILEQNYSNLEYIVIDGKSSDKTLKIVNQYKDQISLIVSEKDTGIYNAMNKGIKLATGDLIATLNADDWLEKGALNTISQAYIENEFDILHGNLTFVGDQHIYKKPNFKKWIPFWVGMPFFHPTFYVRKHIYEELLYDENYRVISDYKFTMQCLIRKYRFHYLDENIAFFSMGGASSGFWIRLKEGHSIRKQLGFGSIKTLLSTMFRLGIGLKSYLLRK